TRHERTTNSSQRCPAPIGSSAVATGPARGSRVRGRARRRPRPEPWHRSARRPRPDRPRLPTPARRPDPRAAGSADAPGASVMSSGVSVVKPPATARVTMQQTSPPAATRSPDPESQQWLEALSATGPNHQDAVDRLHAILIRAARFEIARRRRDLAGSQPGELEDLATQAAADALMAIMRKLHTFRGDSRFTTW